MKNLYICLLCIFNWFGLNAQNVTYSPLHNDNTFTRVTDTTLPVGSIPGDPGTTSAGGASYSIPIVLPPGTNSVVPNLSIDYNSNAITGPLGFGWSISGLSVISRVGNSLYYDGKVSPVELSMNDRFVLDGNRLIATDGSYGAADSKYSTEVESFSTITAKGVFGNGPEWFEVVTKEGVVMEYGNTQYSRFKDISNVSVLFWRINKIKYPDGNYIEFDYSSSDRDSRVTEIRYTGNSNTGKLPFNKIAFSYVNRSPTGDAAGFHTIYIAGSSVVSKYLIDKITITAESSLFKTYKFSYANDINIYLKEIAELGSDGVSQLNSTIFKYGDTPAKIVKGNGPQLPTGNIDFFSGDYDGNGRSDVLWAYYTTFQYSTPNGAMTSKRYTGFNILKDGGTSNTTGDITLDPGTVFRSNMNAPSDYSFLRSDFDGDGRDDLMTCKIGTGNFTEGARSQLTEAKIYYSSTPTSSQIQMTPRIYPIVGIGQSCIPKDKDYIFNGDFDGDGRQEFFTLLQSPAGDQTYGKYYDLTDDGDYGYDIYTLTNNSTTPSGLGSVWGAAKRVYIIDFDGDGKDDVMTVQGSLVRIYTLDKLLTGGNMSFKLLYSSTTLMKDTDFYVYFGDFNLDGKSDIIFRNEIAADNDRDNPWFIARSTGVGFTKTGFYFPYLPGGVGPSPTADLFQVADFNGDGRSDIYHQYTLGATTETAAIYYSAGDSFTYEGNVLEGTSYQPKITGVPFDLNGDGRSEIVYRPTSSTVLGVISPRKSGKEHLLQRVANGYNYICTWSYNNLSAGSQFYTKTGGSSVYPFIFMPTPMYCVSEFSRPDGTSGGNNTIKYNYQGARFHRGGKGFLGFHKVISFNLPMGTRTVVENEFNTTFYAPALKRSATFLTANESLIAETINTNVFVRPSTTSKRFWVKTTNVSATNALEGRTVNTTNVYDDTNGNITKNTVENGVETIETSTIYEAHPGSILNKPSLITTTKTRDGQEPFTVKTKYTYNHLTGQVASKTDFDGLPKKVLTSYLYFSDGNLDQVTKTPYGDNAPSEVTTSMEYDVYGRYPVKEVNELGQTTTYVYDKRWGKPTSTTEVDGLTTSYQYDAFGRLILTTYPASEPYSESQEFKWDLTNGAVWYTSLVHPSKPDIKTWYDILGREIKVQKEGFLSQWITNTKTYDYRGNVQSSTLPYIGSQNIQTTTTLYDLYNRPYNIDMGNFGITTLSYSYSGGKTTVETDSPTGVSSKTTDASGLTIESSDSGGTLAFEYYSHGGIKYVRNGTTIISSNLFDVYGRQTSLTDINAGSTKTKYNAFGKLVEETNPKGNVSTMLYDKLGRITKRTGQEGITLYEYYPTGAADVNQLKKVTGFSGNIEDYTYDSQGRLRTVVETIDGQSHTTTYGYNRYHLLTSKTYPSTFKLNYDYDANGYLTTIKNTDRSVELYRTTAMNELGEVSAYKLGNGKTSAITYTNGFPTQYFTEGRQELNLVWDYPTGNLTSRTDGLKSKQESFTYDELNRLKTSTISGSTVFTTDYASNGNITNKKDAGSYTYDLSKINAVTAVTNVAPSPIPLLQQTITYTPYLRPSTITENGVELTYTYGSDYNRIKSVSNTNVTKSYFKEFEKHVSGSVTTYIQYIDSPAGLVGIVLNTGSTPSSEYKFTYTDHLGSILTVTNSSGAVETEQSFDAWGRRRNPTSWALLSPTAATTLPYWLYRGYTGHEHLDQFGLINMNARLYDPVVGRMLSPDNFVQDGFNTQDYNRYTYAKNNPLKYNDPDGNTPLLLISFLTAAYQGAILNGIGYSLGTLNKGDDLHFTAGGFGKSLLIGGLNGAASFGIGQAAMFFGGVNRIIFQTGAHAVSQGLISTLQGNSFEEGFSAGLFGNLSSSGDGSAGAAMFVGGMSSMANGGNFWIGAAQAGSVNLFNHQMHMIDDDGPGGINDNKRVPKPTNWLNDYYTGPNNPIGYGIKPRNLRDYYSMLHDLEYDANNAKGVNAVFFDGNVIGADLRFAYRQSRLAARLVLQGVSLPSSAAHTMYKEAAKSALAAFGIGLPGISKVFYVSPYTSKSMQPGQQPSY